MPDFSSHSDTILICALIGASLLPIVWILAFYCRRVALVARTVRNQSGRDMLPAMRGTNSNAPEWPGVSVIVYSAGEASALGQLLPELLNQEYTGQMEVIVVNDGRNEAVKDCVTLLQSRHRNLRITYTPEESRNLSRKKLSLTLGIKAARHGIIVLTEERAQLPGSQWLCHIVDPMVIDESVEMVIGYSAPDHMEDHSRGARYRSFDHAAEGVAYLSSALRGKPWRGTGFNLAYRRDMFFRNKGFGHSLNLHTGDDDIFVSEVATDTNCAVEISDESQMTVRCADHRRYHRNERTNRAFSAGKIKRRPSMFFGISSAMMWLWVILSCAAIAVGWQQWWVYVAVAISACMLWIPVMVIWHRTLRALHARRLFLSIPGMLLRRPFTNRNYRRRAYKHRQQNYTWRTPA